MTKIDLLTPHTEGVWAVGIAKDHNSAHARIDFLLEIMGITLPQLARLEVPSIELEERNHLSQLLEIGVHQLTSQELADIHYLVWQLTGPDETHFETFFRDQGHDHPGLNVLVKATDAEHNWRTTRSKYHGVNARVDTVARWLGENSKPFNLLRKYVQF